MALLRLNGEDRLCLKSTGANDELIETPVLRNALLLIDTSGSMAGNKISQAKQGATDFARSANLRGFAAGLAVFGDRAAMVCDPTFEANTFQKKIARVNVGIVGNSTNLAAGLQLANKFVNLNAVVVVTDGQPDSQGNALRAADALKQRGIDILCIGTDDADRLFLAKLATRNDLAMHVDSQNLGKSIEQSSQLLLRNGL
jgi:Mg-chelatase subunit ChlD